MQVSAQLNMNIAPSLASPEGFQEDFQAERGGRTLLRMLCTCFQLCDPGTHGCQAARTWSRLRAEVGTSWWR